MNLNAFPDRHVRARVWVVKLMHEVCRAGSLQCSPVAQIWTPKTSDGCITKVTVLDRASEYVCCTRTIFPASKGIYPSICPFTYPTCTSQRAIKARQGNLETDTALLAVLSPFYSGHKTG